MKVIILAGGYGSRLGHVSELIPKPMVEIGGHPIIWHIMKIYAYYGYNEFVIALGYKANVIKDYFYKLQSYNSDFTVNTATGEITYHNGNPDEWKELIANAKPIVTHVMHRLVEGKNRSHKSCGRMCFVGGRGQKNPEIDFSHQF